MQATLWLMGNDDGSRPRARASAESGGSPSTTHRSSPPQEGGTRRCGSSSKTGSICGSRSEPPAPIRANAIRDRLLADRSLNLGRDRQGRENGRVLCDASIPSHVIGPQYCRCDLDGGQPPELTARKLMDDTRLPVDQRAAAAGPWLRLRRQRSSRSELCGSISFHSLFSFWLARQEYGRLMPRLPYHQNPRTRPVRFRSPHSRTHLALAVQRRLRYAAKPRKWCVHCPTIEMTNTLAI